MNISTKQIAIASATLVTIAINALAEILPINGISTKAISDQFDVFFVPAGYVFSIWGVIYLLLLVFSFGYAKVQQKGKAYVDEIMPLYLFSGLLNCVWIVLWHYGFYLTSVVVIVALLVTLTLIYSILLKNSPVTLAEKLVIHMPFWVYLGWVSVATIANIADVLWLLHWNGFGLTGDIWAAIMMLIAGILATYITLVANKKDFAFALVVLWALIGIMVKFPGYITVQYAALIAIVTSGISWFYQRFSELKSKKQS